MRVHRIEYGRHLTVCIVRALCVAATSLAMLAPARADLVGRPATPPALNAPARAMLDENPALVALEASHPWLVRMALKEIAPAGDDRARHDHNRAESVRPRALNGAYRFLLQTNSGFASLYRSSPEAAVDLLALIRAASGKGGTSTK